MLRNDEKRKSGCFPLLDSGNMTTIIPNSDIESVLSLRVRTLCVIYSLLTLLWIACTFVSIADELISPSKQDQERIFRKKLLFLCNILIYVLKVNN